MSPGSGSRRAGTCSAAWIIPSSQGAGRGRVEKQPGEASSTAKLTRELTRTRASLARAEQLPTAAEKTKRPPRHRDHEQRADTVYPHEPSRLVDTSSHAPPPQRDGPQDDGDHRYRVQDEHADSGPASRLPVHERRIA